MRRRFPNRSSGHPAPARTPAARPAGRPRDRASGWSGTSATAQIGDWAEFLVEGCALLHAVPPGPMGPIAERPNHAGGPVRMTVSCPVLSSFTVASERIKPGPGVEPGRACRLTLAIRDGLGFRSGLMTRLISGGPGDVRGRTRSIRSASTAVPFSPSWSGTAHKLLAPVACAVQQPYACGRGEVNDGGKDSQA